MAGTHNLERRNSNTVAEINQMFEVIAPDAELQRRRQRIDNGNAHTVQAAGNLVGVLIEFTASVQLSHDHFGGGYTLFVHVHRNTTAIVSDGDRSIFV